MHQRPGGTTPVWAHSGEELFFVDGDDRMILAAVRTDLDLQIRERQVLFDTGESYTNASNTLGSVSPDDQRFLMVRPVGGEDAEARFVLVNSLFEVLKERVPN